MPLLTYILSLDHSYENSNNRDNQQYMNDPADMKSEEAKKPANDQDDCYDIK